MTHASHRAKSITRRTKALTLIPVTVASCAATAVILATTGAAAPLVAVAAKPVPAPIVTVPVPVKPFEFQATVTQHGKVAPATGAVVDVSAVTASGIPAVALAAYQRSAQIINASDPSCQMPWELLGAIGRVESDNGQFGGSQLTTSGEATPPIYGPLLDGKNGTADLPGAGYGALDGNSAYQRAVGPMQFLPSTWAVIGQDGNGDGVKDPENIYDASLAAAVYLCSGEGDMTNASSLKSAIFRYNHSENYVKLVVAIMKAYEAGDFASIPSGAYAADAPSKSVLPKKHKTGGAAATATAHSTPSATTSPSHAASPSPSITPTPSKSTNPLQNLLNGLSGKKTATPTPSSTPMTAAQAGSYCSSKLAFGVLNPSYSACTKKLTGLSQTEAASEWAAHASDLAAWFKS